MGKIRKLLLVKDGSFESMLAAVENSGGDLANVPGSGGLGRLGNLTSALEATTTIGNYSALAQRSEFETGDGEHGVTCFTCVNVSNNHVCNQYAIDRPCKHGNNFCHSLHIMDPRGGTVLVNKKCANETECAPSTIGCYLIDNQKICISCCDEDYCNKAVPSKKSNAVFRNTKTVRQKLQESYNDRNRKNKKLLNSKSYGCHISSYSCPLIHVMCQYFILYYSTLIGTINLYHML